MQGELAYGQPGTANPDRTRSLFGQAMGVAAITAGCFTLAAYLNRGGSSAGAQAGYIFAYACLVAMKFTVRRTTAGATVLLLVFGALLGLATSPVLAYFTRTGAQILWQAGGATALFIAGFGAIGYATRRDLSALWRVSLVALLLLIVSGIVLIFMHVSPGALIYSALGLLIFAGLIMADFQRLRRSRNLDSGPLITVSIFLDALNVFLVVMRFIAGGTEG
jgi:FtsH-binding integral membrane protein